MDLNIDHYSKQILEQLFDLTPGYNIHDIEAKKNTLCRLMSNDNPTKSREIELFVNQAKDMLIPKEVVPFIYTQPDNYFQGKLNPIEKRIITRILCIDSLFRNNYDTTSSNNFIYKLPEQFKNVISMKIVSVELPIMWYMFSDEKKNNLFTFNSTEYKIKEGNYSVDTFNFNYSQSESGNTLENINISIDPVTSKTTITINNIIGTIHFNISSLSLFQTAGWMLGFRKSSYVFNLDNNFTITSESSFGSTVDNYFFLEIDDYHNNFITDSIISVLQKNGQSSYLGKNIMAKIPITTNFNSILQNTSSDGLFKSRDYLGPVRLEKLQLRLINRFGDLIALNSNDYSISIELKELYS
jgi:hypothetical protein